MEITLKQVEISKLKVEPGEVLLVRVGGPEFHNPNNLQSFQNALKKVFPNNQVLVISLDEDHKVEMEVVSAPAEPQAENCETAEVGYCSSCNCGKKEAVLARKASTEEVYGEESTIAQAGESLTIEAPTVGDPEEFEKILNEFKVKKEEQEAALKELSGGKNESDPQTAK